MKNLTSKPRWAGLCALVLVATALFGLPAVSAEKAAPAPETARADLITIDAMKKDMPAVTFVHDKHTMALAAEGKDCSACHAPLKEAGKEGSFSFVLQGTDGKTGTALKEAFHAKCISCHTETGRAGKPTGPLEANCRGCHSDRPDLTNAWKDIGFDKLLHYKHVMSSAIPPVGDPNLNCGACHHVYDQATKKPVWAKDKEDSCRACHLMPEEQKALLAKAPGAADDNGKFKDRLTFQDAGHTACVGCHLRIAALKRPDLKVGPTDCAGCHSPRTQAKLTAAMADTTVATSIPRLMRGQPDAAMMLPVSGVAATAPGAENDPKGTMKPVAFNHKFHEGVTKDCRTCHHKKIAACSTCHTLEGSAKSNGVSLYEAMHKVQSDRSCAGCHNKEKQKPTCAGCHASMPKNAPADSCGGCHAVPVGLTAAQAEDGSLLKAGKEQLAALAEATVNARKDAATGIFDQTEIPDQVTIGALSKEYGPVTLPHRKIVKALLEKQSENRLAAVFHSDKASLCRGCHHNSPASKTPPKCVSCHSIEGHSVQTGRPALKAAYHQQCMSCHAAMNQKPAATDCTEGCHKPRGN